MLSDYQNSFTTNKVIIKYLITLQTCRYNNL